MEKAGIFTSSSAYTVDGVKISMQVKSAIIEFVYFLKMEAPFAYVYIKQHIVPNTTKINNILIPNPKIL